MTPKAVAAGANPVRRWLVHTFQERGDEPKFQDDRPHIIYRLLQGVGIVVLPVIEDACLESGANIIAGRSGARATGFQDIEQEIIVPGKSAKFLIMPSMLAKSPAMTLYTDNNSRIGGGGFLNQSERDRHPRILRNVVEIDPQPVIRNTVDHSRIDIKQSFVGDQFIIERRQHQHACRPDFHRILRQRDRVGESSASGPRDQRSALYAAFRKGSKHGPTLRYRKRTCLAGGARHSKPIAALIKQPSAVIDLRSEVRCQILTNRCQHGGEYAATDRFASHRQNLCSFWHFYAGQVTIRSSGSSPRSSGTTRLRTEIPA